MFSLIEKPQKNYRFQSPINLSDGIFSAVVEDPTNFDSWVVAILNAQTQKLKDEIVSKLRGHEVITEDGNSIRLLDDPDFNFKNSLDKLINQELKKIKATKDQEPSDRKDKLSSDEKLKKINYGFRETNTSKELKIPTDLAKDIVVTFLKTKGQKGYLENTSAGNESGIVFFTFNGEEYVIKLTDDTTIKKQLSGQKFLEENGITQFAPLTMVEIFDRELLGWPDLSTLGGLMAEFYQLPMKYLVQKKIKGLSTDYDNILKSMENEGIRIGDPKGNIIMSEHQDGVIRPIIIDLSYVGRAKN